MVRHAPIHRRSGHSDIAICCGRNVRGSSPSTSVVPLSNQVTTLNHKRFKGFKMFSDGHLDAREASTAGESIAMARFLIVLGLAILVIGLLWPYLGKLGLGRLPGDIVIERENGTIYVPLATCLLLSLLLSLVFWIANR